MTKGSTNEGILQTGGTINADQIAVGQNARAIRCLSQAKETLERAGLKEIEDRLVHLVQVLEDHTSSLSNRDEIINSTETLARELAEVKPNKLTLISLLEGIAGRVNSVTVVATAIEALKSAIASLM
ncbi:MAG TPA: hypothetical protein VK582_22695 [Pyrinomonadaceae bacterium]|nr:hypothetical protein [Pyrinomonadaceae bacterium]